MLRRRDDDGRLHRSNTAFDEGRRGGVQRLIVVVEMNHVTRPRCLFLRIEVRWHWRCLQTLAVRACRSTVAFCRGIARKKRVGEKKKAPRRVYKPAEELLEAG